MRLLWGEKEDEQLRGLIAENLTFAEIGKIMGRNKNSCIGRAHRLGVKSSETKPMPQPKVKIRVEAPKAPEPVAPAETPLYAPPEASTTAFGVPRTLLHLRERHCKFPVSERRGQYLFCCGERVAGRPYCQAHSDICYRETERQSLSRLMKAYR